MRGWDGGRVQWWVGTGGVCVCVRQGNLVGVSVAGGAMEVCVGVGVRGGVGGALASLLVWPQGVWIGRMVFLFFVLFLVCLVAEALSYYRAPVGHRKL